MESIPDFLAANYPSKRFGTTLTYVDDVQQALKDVFRGEPDKFFPLPKMIFVNHPRPERLWGYPIIRSARLVNALFAYLQAEITNQYNIVRRQLGDERAVIGGREYEMARGEYVEELRRVFEACMLNSFGQRFQELFWLDHSLDVADAMSKVRNKVLQLDVSVGQQHGDTLKYRVYQRYLEAAVMGLERVMDALPAGLVYVKEDYHSELFRLMRENVLCFTELPTRLQLDDLESFVTAYLKKDFREFLAGVERFRDVAAQLYKKDSSFQAFVRSFWPKVTGPADLRTDRMLFDPRFRAVLFSHPKAGPKRFSEEFQSLIGEIGDRLIRYDFIHYFRSLIKRCVRTKDETLGKFALEQDKGVLLDHATRPYNFGHPMIMDNYVRRFGLVYDITAFSETYFQIKATSAGHERESARQMFNFMETLAALPVKYPLRFEKFLGDGAFYSSRQARALLEAAVIIQETYAKAVDEGFPFKRGMRVALNWSYYYLLPLRNPSVHQGLMYDFFGPGLIELTRLTSGKSSKEIQDVKDLLIGHGYPIESVHKFFSHLEESLSTDRNANARHEIEGRRFFVLVDEKGNLMNEGIVATRQFVERLSDEINAADLRQIEWRNGSYGGIHLPSLHRWVAIREAGVVKVKGLDPFLVYETVPFTEADKEEGVFRESRPESGRTLADLVLDEEVLDSSGMPLGTDEALIVGEADHDEVGVGGANYDAYHRGSSPDPFVHPMAADEGLSGEPVAPGIPASADDLAPAAPAWAREPRMPPAEAPQPSAPEAPPQTPAQPPASPPAERTPAAAQAAPQASASGDGREIACFVYEIEPGKGKCFVIGRFDRRRKSLENAIVEPKAIKVTDRVRIANIYKQLEQHPGRVKERIDLTQYARHPDFKLVLLGVR